MLSLKHTNPQAVLLFPTDGTDVGHVRQAMQNLEWNVPVIGGYGAHYSEQIAKVAGPSSMKNLVATTYAPFGACPASGTRGHTEVHQRNQGLQPQGIQGTRARPRGRVCGLGEAS